MSRSRDDRRQRGFTLLEILVSISLLALLIALAYGSIRVALQASRSGEALIDRNEELRTTQGFLRRQFGQMMPLLIEADPQTGEQRRFSGEAREVQFVAPMPGYLSRGGAHVQSLTLVDGARGLQLEFRHAQLNGFDPEMDWGDLEPVVLIDGIRDGRFLFKRIEDGGELGEWDSEWEHPDQLPLLLRLELEFEDGDRRSWPEFETAAMAANSRGRPSFDNLRFAAPAVSPVNPGMQRPRESP